MIAYVTLNCYLIPISLQLMRFSCYLNTDGLAVDAFRPLLDVGGLAVDAYRPPAIPCSDKSNDRMQIPSRLFETPLSLPPLPQGGYTLYLQVGTFPLPVQSSPQR